MKEAATNYSFSTSLISKIWKIGKQHQAIQLEALAAFSPKRKARCGRKRRAIPLDLVQNVLVKKRRTVRVLGRNIGIPKSTVHDHMRKFDDLAPHSNSINPLLTPTNEIDRLIYDLAHILLASLPHTPVFQGSYEDIQVNEKWCLN